MEQQRRGQGGRRVPAAGTQTRRLEDAWLEDMLQVEGREALEERLRALMSLEQRPPCAVLVAFIPDAQGQGRVQVTPTLPMDPGAATELLLAGVMELRRLEQEQIQAALQRQATGAAPDATPAAAA